MDSEEKKMLEHILRLTQDNNKMLRQVRGVQKRAALFRTLYWLFIIGAAVGAFYFVQPYVDKIQQVLQASGINIGHIQNTAPKQTQ